MYDKIRKKSSRDYKSDILNCIISHPSGVTIQNISDEIGAARNTISKYIYRLKLEKKVFNKKLGAYNLYFSIERNFIPLQMVVNHYKGFIYSLKKRFPNQEEIFKKIGRDIAKFTGVTLKYLPKFEEKIDSIKNLTVKNFFKIFSEFYPNFSIFQKSLEVSDIRVNYKENKAIYRFHHSSLIEKNDDFIYHFYIICGVIEIVVSNALDKMVICNIENIHIAEEKGESYVDISIEIH